MGKLKCLLICLFVALEMLNNFRKKLNIAHNVHTVKVVIFARVIFRASAIFDIFACF